MDVMGPEDRAKFVDSVFYDDFKTVKIGKRLKFVQKARVALPASSPADTVGRDPVEADRKFAAEAKAMLDMGVPDSLAPRLQYAATMLGDGPTGAKFRYLMTNIEHFTFLQELYMACCYLNNFLHLSAPISTPSL